MPEEDKVIPVRVALRCRPLINKEILEGCQSCIRFIPNEPQVVIGVDKAFTYDYVFSPEVSQQHVYDKSVSVLIDKLFKGYNVTVLAYGQTGSGKTYTMGTSSALESEENVGIIPRAVKDIFNTINEITDAKCSVKISFLEIYKEEIFDLLNNNKDKDSITIRENFDGSIRIVGLTETIASSLEETMQLLETGTLTRTTAATAMNFNSSRSHAIFTITLEQCNNDTDDIIYAKFHFVDLAGSERAKKTGAQGERLKEGININRGLLALGNVISSLCNESSHVPYRDSKLTRLLQDSLGGNSHTIMIACVSPADFNLDETVNTLRYADRARKIKNKPIINIDSHGAEIAHLKQLVQQLQLQLLQANTTSGIDCLEESSKRSNFKILLDQNKKLEEENRRLAKELQSALDQTTKLCEKALLAEMTKDKLLQRLEEIKDKIRMIINSLNEAFENNPELQEKLELIKELQDRIVNLQIEQTTKCDFSLFSPTNKEKQDMDTGNDGDGDDDDKVEQEQNDDNAEENEYQLQSTLRQAAMNRELQELEHALALKEDLAFRMKENDSQMAVMRLQYETCLKELEEEVSKLQKEKELLSNQLKVVHTNNNTSKISEQRRKRLQELEVQISQLKKEMTEKARMLKMKEEADRKVKVLQQEIQEMKQARVRLLKQMKEEAEKYRQWKLEKDRELARLRQQDRKRQYELVKMEKIYTKQKNVLKRKMEEAVAANKKLQMAMQQQRAISERREREKDQTLQGMGNRIRQWLQQELDLVVSSKEADHHLQNILEDRKSISEQLNNLKNQVQQMKQQKTNDDPDVINQQQQINQLQQDLDLRNAQIADLQQRILDVDQDEKAKHRWENMNSMVETKCALKWLFENAVTAKIDMFLSERKCREFQNTLEDITKINEEQKEEIEKMKKKHQEELVSQAREHEDKTLYLLKQMQHSSNSNLTTSHSDVESSLIERIKFQENEITRLSYLYDELQQKSNECEALKKKLLVSKYKGSRTSLLPEVFPKESGAAKKKVENVIIESSEPESEHDENDDDPDWIRTPYLKRIQKKRKCNCNGKCRSKVCGCRRSNQICTRNCKCNKENCTNRSESSSPVSQESGGETMLNTTFNVNSSGERNAAQDKNSKSTKDTFVQPFQLSPTEESESKSTLGNDENILETEGIVKKKRRKHNTTFFNPLF
ncbi:chromosome-associated kinesin KIF4 [Centruroides vittatus]|uniref:chromosome-associated kinesin KIF4 n=1 Tax=Centruroides vittatus TaxID=120091 RepID=UPI003510725F